MKNILFIGLMAACLFSFGKCCKKKKCTKKKENVETTAADEIWMQYDETKCANPWNFNWFAKPTEEQVLGAVQSDLKGKGIDVQEIKSITEKDFISCEACTCPNGTHFYVRVNKSASEKLKALKFYEIKEVPTIKAIDTTK